jgi:glycosyltransferase involved in cell wall biosynthesis
LKDGNRVDTDLCLTLFFTRGVSLRTWDRAGLLEREVALYRRLQERGVQVAFVTYGGRADLAYRNRLPGIRILCNRWGLPLKRYERWLPWLHLPSWLRATVLKTNQVEGGEVALRVARRLGKKLIARCGYLLSDVSAREYGPDSPEAERARALEARLFTGADRVIVTTPAMRQTVVARYNLPENKVAVIPNYVDTDLFKPNSVVLRRPGRLCFVGRLEEEKNLFALLEAVRGLGVELVLVGNGRLRESLEAKAQAEHIPAQFLGALPHRALPEVLNSTRVFILPSLYEGHPKTLIEAMACGLPVIGTDTPGIRDLITHRETGFLCGTTPAGLRAAILEVLGDADLRARMGRNAREFVVEHFALERVVEMEWALLAELADGAS